MLKKSMGRKLLEKKICSVAGCVAKDYEIKGFLRSYGFKDLKEYEDLVASQNNLCAICGKPETVIRRGKVQRLSVDHCHTTKKIRGLLCVTCNNILGNAHDDIDKLKRAIKYLESSED